jgi:hypothetical protein
MGNLFGEDDLKIEKEAFQQTLQTFLNGFSKKAGEAQAVSDLRLLFKIPHELSGTQ